MEEKKNTTEEVTWNEQVQAIIKVIGAIVGVIAIIYALSNW